MALATSSTRDARWRLKRWEGLLPVTVAKILRPRVPWWPPAQSSSMWKERLVQQQTNMGSKILGRSPETKTEQSQEHGPRAFGLLTQLSEFCPSRHLSYLLARLREFCSSSFRVGVFCSVPYDLSLPIIFFSGRWVGDGFRVFRHADPPTQCRGWSG